MYGHIKADTGAPADKLDATIYIACRTRWTPTSQGSAKPNLAKKEKDADSL